MVEGLVKQIGFKLKAKIPRKLWMITTVVNRQKTNAGDGILVDGMRGNPDVIPPQSSVYSIR